MYIGTQNHFQKKKGKNPLSLSKLMFPDVENRLERELMLQVDDEEDEEEINCVSGKKSSHKQAEQKRRDSLKYCFEEINKLLPVRPIHLRLSYDNKRKGGRDKEVSRLGVLTRGKIFNFSKDLVLNCILI